jgi:hypothetical protein
MTRGARHRSMHRSHRSRVQRMHLPTTGWRCHLSSREKDFPILVYFDDFSHPLGNRATVFPEAPDRPRPVMKAKLSHCTLSSPCYFPRCSACVGLCNDLRPGLPSRDRHLRRGAELKNRALSASGECPWYGVSPATACTPGPVAKL